MFIVRRAKIDDVSTLLKLAKMVHFINLPADKDIVSAKVVHSRNCFLKAAGSDAQRHETVPMPRSIGAEPSRGNGQITGLGSELTRNDLFMFVVEDTETGSCLGTSQIMARMGGPGNPNVSFTLEKRQFFSTSLQSGTTQVVATLTLDESSPTEIGGLILQPSFRRHKAKLGRMLALIRFHFVGLHRSLFADRIIAEMMAPITADGNNLLWDYLGRRFIALSYDEADRFCQYSREFMLNLLPREPIYLTLLPPAARAVVGQVNEETVPARRMLEKLGFQYTNRVDPFDGGPHLEAATDSIQIVKDSRWATVGEPITQSKCTSRGFVSHLAADGEFRGIEEAFSLTRGRVSLPRAAMKLLEIEVGARVGVTPMPKPGQSRGPSQSKKAKTRRKATK